MRKLLLAFTLLLVAACSSSTSNEENPPELPDLSQARPTFEYFKAKTVASASDDNFQLASQLTLAMDAIITGFSTVPENFLQLAENSDASFDDGVWSWEYSASGSGSSVNVRLTAEESNSNIKWAMYLTVSSQEQNFDNYKFMDGTVSTDGNTGDWNFYPFEQESTTPVMTFSWNITSETQATYNIAVSTDGSLSTITYTKNNSDNTLTIAESISSGPPTVIYWNSSTGYGYFDDGNQQRVCWDSNSQNIDCS